MRLKYILRQIQADHPNFHLGRSFLAVETYHRHIDAVEGRVHPIMTASDHRRIRSKDLLHRRGHPHVTRWTVLSADKSRSPARGQSAVPLQKPALAAIFRSNVIPLLQDKLAGRAPARPPRLFGREHWLGSEVG